MSETKIPVVAVVGPTASGKTALAVELALRFGGEVVSADSMQVYKGMDVGTAKPTAEERKGVPHHLMGFLPPGEPFSVARYVELAGEAVRDIHSRGRLPILAGGTGLYVSSLLDGVDFGLQETGGELRERLTGQARLEGGAALLARLRQVDPVTAERLHENDLHRIVRALEVWERTGEPLSAWIGRSKTAESPYDPLLLGLSYRDREALYRRIDLRVDGMLRSGLWEETRRLWEAGALQSGTASQAIGYKELLPALRGEESAEAAAERLKRNTRRYAKRQLTWFRRDERIHWLYADEEKTFEPLEEKAIKMVADFVKR